MGTGKTTLGRALHGVTAPDGTTLHFTDLDEAIESAEGITIAEIFRLHGEAYFRQAETRMLRTLAARPGTVVACGGGTPCQQGNMQWINSHGITVLLEASHDTLLRRLTEGQAKRPLLAGMDADALSRFISTKLAEREPYYSQATLRFPSDRLENQEEIEQTSKAFLHLITNLQ